MNLNTETRLYVVWLKMPLSSGAFKTKKTNMQLRLTLHRPECG
ncbi:MAG TPA: hypothetical protein V6D37_14620 [Candidatus Sericytochromatia bacterium]